MLIRATALFDVVPGAVAVTTGPAHVVSALGPAAGHWPGLVPDRPVSECVPDAHADAVAAVLDAVLACGDGAVVDVAGAPVGCAPLRDASGSVTGVLLHLAQHGGDIEEALARGAALQHLAAELAQKRTYADVAELTVTAGARLSEADAASVYVLPPDSDALDLVLARGWPDETVRRFSRIVLHRGRPLSDSVLDASPVWLEDAGQWRSRYPDMAPIGTAIGYEATACIPMCTDERVVGAVTFSFVSPRRFSPSEREYLLAVTALCTQAFDRVRLLEAESSARADEERRLRWLTYLAEAGPLLEAPLATEERVQRLADLAVSEVADWCAVHLVRDDRVDRVAVSHVDPRKRAFVADLEKRYPPDPDNPAGAIHVSRTGQAVYVPEIPDEMLVQVARDPEHLDLIRSIGMRSAAVVPLVVRGTSIGALTLVQAESGRTIDRTDLAFIHQLAAGAAIALDNARLYEQQRTVAETLQRALLPEDVPPVPGVRLAARYRPYGPERTGFLVGGDLFDVVRGAQERWAVTVADVCGKGPPAAALTAMIRHTIRTEVRHGLGPEEVLRRLNDAMIEDAGTGVARFATAVHAHVSPDPTGADVTVVNAGHVAPLLLRGGEVAAVQSPGVLLGVYPDVTFTPVDLRLQPGDTLLLFTDGVTEARGTEGFYGEERLAGLLASLPGRTAEEVADAVIADVTAFDRGDSRDDVVVLVLQPAA